MPINKRIKPKRTRAWAITYKKRIEICDFGKYCVYLTEGNAIADLEEDEEIVPIEIKLLKPKQSKKKI